MMSVICGQRHDIISLIVLMTLDIDVLDIGQTFDIGFLTLTFLTLALTSDFGDIHNPESDSEEDSAVRFPEFGPVWGSRGQIQLQGPNQLIVF